MKFNTRSLRFKLIVFESIILAMIIMTAVGIFTRTRENIYEQNTKYVNEILVKMSQNIKNRIKIIENIIFSTSVNNDIKNFIMSESKLEQVENIKRIDKYLIPIKNIDDKILDIAILGENGNEYGLGVIAERKEKVKKSILQMKNNVNPQLLGMVEIEDKNIMVVANKVYDQSNTESYRDIIGTIVILISDKMFEEELVGEEKLVGNFVVVDEADKLIWSDGTYKIGEVLNISDSNLIINELYIPEVKMKIVSINTKQQLLKDVNKTLPLYMIMIGIMLMIPIATYIFLTLSLLKPLSRISLFISNLISGDLRYFNKRIAVKGSYEVEVITNEINNLLDEVKDLTHRLVETTSNLYGAEAEKSRAELEFLKSQINPHFLYNTLGMIKGIAIIKKEKEISDITSCLAKILNYSIKGEDIVTLQEEINITKAYILIQQSRFKDRFEVEYDIPVEVLEVKIIKLLFQPIIENAVFHGIEPTSKKGLLIIGGRLMKDEKQVILWVKDNGIGISRKKLDFITQKLNDHGIWSKEHVGIININSRIRHEYGNEYGINIESIEGEGTQVTIIVPYLS